MDETLTLDQAGQRLGVDEDHLKRMIRTGGLPEARKVAADDGATWVLPAAALGDIAARHGWTIDVRDDNQPAVYPAQREVLDGKLPAPVAAGAGAGETVETTEADDATERRRQRREELALAEIVDTALLDRLLGAHEEKAEALARNREVEQNLAVTNDAYQRASELLEVERRERTIALERLREEQKARSVADAKVAELRDRLMREMSGHDTERQARRDATERSLRAERDAATAVASMGWLSRRRYERLVDDEAGEY